MVRVIRIFVSSPGDVAKERKVLDEVVERINQTDGDDKQVRLELWKWEKNVVPQIGPPPQRVVESQKPFCDVYLGILSRRFGTPTGRYRSGTEKEFRDDLKRWGKVGKPWILFYFNDSPKLPKTKEERAQWDRVCDFREELEKRGIVGVYRGVLGSKGFFLQVDTHLRLVLKSFVRLQPASRAKSTIAKQTSTPKRKPTIPAAYIKWLKLQCVEIERQGLGLKHGQSARLDNVYVPLTTSAGTGGEPKGEADLPRRAFGEREKPQLLLDLLDRQSLYVSGAPGSGKSTFCRWATWLLCEGAMPPQPIPAPEGYSENFPRTLDNRLPLSVRLREFWPYLPEIPDCRELSSKQLEDALRYWLEKKEPGGLTWDEVEAHLRYGSALLIFDGVDEVPAIRGEELRGSKPRQMLVSGLIDAVSQWTGAGNRVLITSRPYALEEEDVRKLGILHAPLEDLREALQELLVRRWFHILEVSSETGADSARKMIADMRGRDELGTFAANPLLLTAMCVVYHEGRRLPQDKADLYARTVERVLFNRYPDPQAVDLVQARLSAIAYGMHTGEGLDEQRTIPLAEVTYGDMDRVLEGFRRQSRLSEDELKNILDTRSDLLSRSGLLISQGKDRAAFYHLSFQDYFAAKRLLDLEGGKLLEAFQLRAPVPEWRNALSFAFAVLQAERRTQAISFLDRLMACVQPDSPLGLQVVVADCLEIVVGKGIRPDEKLREHFLQICLTAIEREVTVRERMVLGLALGQLGDPRIVSDLRQREGYVEIPAGDYSIGGERKPYKLRKPFLLARYPVTNRQYRLFVEDEQGYENPKWWSDEGKRWLKKSRVSEPALWSNSKWNGANQPVVGISFWEAEAFCNSAGGRLPTEQEWEAAARGPARLEYPWGNEWTDGIANSREAGLRVTSPVGLFPRSRSKTLGLEDMAGNVWEWTSSLYDPRAKELGASRVLRGGGWFLDARDCRSACRYVAHPTYRYDRIGFRPARSLPSSL
jgi:formylglycine-generating enzyme required for sulfatase activity